ncbi:MAG: 2-oxo acid dehydrogenase subunit E2 [Chitinophagales bacterium]|nr:2-oxo acid dehydrogenase subunit E2 [Chitinophagales bacterium]
MAEVDLIMPKMGESIMEATILKWLKKEGDSVAIDEPILEIATDKVDSEVPSTHSGTISKILYQINDVIPVGKTIAIIQTEGNMAVKPVVADSRIQQISDPEIKVPFVPKPEIRPVVTEARFYSPLVLNIARSEGIAMNELEAIPGTGEGGRVTKKDILNFVKSRGQEEEETKQESPPVKLPDETFKGPAVSTSGNTEIIEMDRMRRLIADHMVMSKRTSPHVTSFVEADVTHLVLWRERIKNAFEKREGEKITFTPLFIEAIVKAIKEFPMVNASVDGTKMIRKKDINIGMAAATPSGNLIVPVIKNADTKNLVGLTKEVNDLARRARNAQLKPHEIEGGTFTITNVGTFGNVMGTPIINQPQVAIIATGAIKKKPAVLETEEGDVIAIRHMMFLSLSYDHRIVDGALGGSFLRKVADYLEQFNPKREY